MDGSVTTYIYVERKHRSTHWLVRTYNVKFISHFAHRITVRHPWHECCISHVYGKKYYLPTETLPQMNDRCGAARDKNSSDWIKINWLCTITIFGLSQIHLKTDLLNSIRIVRRNVVYLKLRQTYKLQNFRVGLICAVFEKNNVERCPDVVKTA